MTTLAQKYDAAEDKLSKARATHERRLAALRAIRTKEGKLSGRDLAALREATDAYDAAYRAMQSAELDVREVGAEIAGDVAVLAETRRIKAERKKALSGGA